LRRSPLLVCSLGQVLDIDVNKTKIILFEGPCSLYRSGGDRGWSTVESLRLQKAPDAVTIEMRQKMRDAEGKVIQSEVGDPAQSADHGTGFFCGLPRQLVRARGVIETVLHTTLTPLADGFGADSVTLGQQARGLLGTGNLGANDRGGAGIRVNLQHALFLSS
jgi:hypothetical protein